MGNISRFVANWVELGDTPGSITANYLVRGNAGGTALEFIDPSTVGTTTFTGLTDTPPNFGGAGDTFVRVNAGATALVFFDLFNTANTWNATQTVQDVVPATDQPSNANVGTDALRFLSVRGRLGVFVGSSTSGGAEPPGTGGTRTFGLNPTGIMAGNQVQGGAGAATHNLKGASFKGVACVGNVHAEAAGEALLNNNSGGSSLFGSAYTTSANDARVTATGFGNFTTCYAYTVGAQHAWSNGSYGGFLSGYSQGAGTVNVNLSGSAPFCNVRPVASNATATVTITASGDGCLLAGAAEANTGGSLAEMQATGAGSVAQGRAFGDNAMISATGAGAKAMGFASGSTIEATQTGAFASGGVTSGAYITASGLGSGAFGYSSGNDIVASATNAFQFGIGTNALADSLQVGTAGIRFKGTTGSPGAPQNGDFWISGNLLALRSDGVDWSFDQSSAFTREATIVEDRTLLASASATVTNNNNVLAAIIADLQVFGVLG